MRYQIVFAVLLAFLSVLACGGDGGGSPPLVTSQMISPAGGRVAWYTGSAATHERIAYDAVVDPDTQFTEVFTMDPDGGNIVNVLRSGIVPGTIQEGFIGQPAWHPDGQHLVVQVKEGGGSRFEHMSFGINNDLWLIAADGTSAELLYSSPANHAALHPHFDEAGTLLMFAEREATGVVEGVWLLAGAPGGENPWAGWRIAIAPFDIDAPAGAKLGSIEYLFDSDPPQDRGFFETHGFFDNGQRIIFSRTLGGQPYVDDIFTAAIDGSGLIQEIDSPSTWDEHGTWSPSGTALAFNSSRANASWVFPGSSALDLTTELFLLEDGVLTRLTDMNGTRDPTRRYLVSDFDWDRTGERIVIQVAPVDSATGVPDPPEIWMLTLSRAR